MAYKAKRTFAGQAFGSRRFIYSSPEFWDSVAEKKGAELFHGFA
jgi:hypothetical protein